MKKGKLLFNSSLALGIILLILGFGVDLSNILHSIARSLSPDGILEDSSIIAINIMPAIAIVFGLILIVSTFTYKYYEQVCTYIKKARIFDVSLHCLMLIFFIRILVFVSLLYGDGLLEVNTSNPSIFRSEQMSIPSKVDEFLHHLRNFDGKWYYEISKHDYNNIFNKLKTQSSEHPLAAYRFFPLYPYLMSIINYLVCNYTISGLIISNIAFFIFIIFLYKLTRFEFDDDIAFKTVFYASIFPSSFFLSVVYTESLFLALIVPSFYYARKQNWFVAGFIGIFAAMTRISGIFLTIPLFFEYMQQFCKSKNDVIRFRDHLNIQLLKNIIFKKHFWAICLIPLGFMLTLLNFWRVSGNPLIFLEAHKAIGANYLFAPLKILNEILILPQLFLVYPFILLIGILIFKFKNIFDKPYFIYMALYFSLHLLHSHSSFIRYSLEIFPIFITLGYFANKNEIIDRLMTFTSSIFLTIFAVMFINGYWVA